MSVLQTIFNPSLINKPLFIEDFVNEDTNYDTAKTLLSYYVKSGDIKRYSQGIYYIPTKTILGYSTISFESIIERKYISDDNKVFGYYSGMSLLNTIGLSSQVPNIPEITTNNEATRKRKVKIGKRSVIVRRSNIEINNDNYLYLQFFDIFRYGDQKAIEDNKNNVLKFFDDNKLKLNKLMEIEKLLPMKIRKIFRRSKIYDELTFIHNDAYNKHWNE